MSEKDKNDQPAKVHDIQPLAELVPGVVSALDPNTGDFTILIEQVRAADERVGAQQRVAIAAAARAALEAAVDNNPEALTELHGLFAEQDEISQRAVGATDDEQAALAEQMQLVTEKIKALTEDVV